MKKDSKQFIFINVDNLEFFIELLKFYVETKDIGEILVKYDLYQLAKININQEGHASGLNDWDQRANDLRKIFGDKLQADEWSDLNEIIDALKSYNKVRTQKNL